MPTKLLLNKNGDNRGVFFGGYRFDNLEEELGHKFNLRRSNTSVSKKGVVRGSQHSDFLSGQAKYITCLLGPGSGDLINVRVELPALSEWETVPLDDKDHNVIYLREGLEYGFISQKNKASIAPCFRRIQRKPGDWNKPE